MSENTGLRIRRITLFDLLAILSLPQLFDLMSKYFWKSFLYQFCVSGFVIPSTHGTLLIEAVNICITQHLQKRNKPRLCILPKLACVNSNIHPLRDVPAETKNEHAIQK